MRRSRIVGCLGAVLGAAALALPAAARAFEEAPCASPAGFLCSQVVVPLDRAGAVPGRVALDVRRLPAAEAPTPTALVAILGGPGQVASSRAGALAEALAPIRGARDLIVADPRGVGRSGALSCRSPRPDRCASELGRARAFYTTADDVEDLEAIRRAGGYERLALHGTSYGTKVALRYAAAHPDRVEALVLDSIVTPEGPDPLQLSTFAAIRRALPALCAGGACARPVEDVAALVRRLQRQPMSARVRTASGRRVGVRLTADSVLAVLVAGDVNPVIRAETPGAVRAARRGDALPLARLRVRGAGTGGVAHQSDGDVNRVRNAATTCEELLFPWARDAPPELRARQALARSGALSPAQTAPFGRRTALTGGVIPVCLRWPTASPAPAASVPLPQGIPALLLAGEQDLRTPLEDARAVAARLGPGAQLVAVPHVGHSVLGADPSGCARTAIAAFLADGLAPACGRVERVVAPTATPVRSVAQLPPYKGVPGLAGRTLTAASRTVSDAQRARLSSLIAEGGARVAGLRGGTATEDADGLRLRRYSYVPGVAISGLVPRDATAPVRLRVTGRAAARGSFTAAGGRIAGGLGGRSFDVPTSPPAARAATRPGGEALPPYPRLARIP